VAPALVVQVDLTAPSWMIESSRASLAQRAGSASVGVTPAARFRLIWSCGCSDELVNVIQNFVIGVVIFAGVAAGWARNGGNEDGETATEDKRSGGSYRRRRHILLFQVEVITQQVVVLPCNVPYQVPRVEGPQKTST